MEPHDTFKFGKYKGLTLRQVYVGSQQINTELIKYTILK